MVAQICTHTHTHTHTQKKLLTAIFWIFGCLLPKTYLIKALNSFGSSRPYKRLLQIQKRGGSRELFLPENDFQPSSTVKFSKNYRDFGGLETNRRHEIQTSICFQFHITYIWTQYNIKISAISFESNTLKKSAGKAKKLNFIIFSALYFWKY